MNLKLAVFPKIMTEVRYWNIRLRWKLTENSRLYVDVETEETLCRWVIVSLYLPGVIALPINEK